MHSKSIAQTAAALALAIPAAARALPGQHAVLFTGQLPFRSLDAGHERPGGAINDLTEYDFVLAIPGATAARSLLPASAMQCYLGDADFDGDYLKLRNWRQSYLQPLGIGGVFVRAADRLGADWRDVFFSVRHPPGVVGQEFEVFVAGTTPYLVEPSDWLRLRPGGASQWFLAPGHLQLAVGPQPTPTRIGASALLQSAAGDLYYSPSDGGHWVSGNGAAPVFADEGAICRIDASAISYDPEGNVAGIAASAARLVADRATVLAWVQHAALFDRVGAPLQSGLYGLTTGLALDPLSGTFTPSHPDASGNYTPQPNLISCSEMPAYGGTLFSSRNGGAVALVNGVSCGSTVAGVPADGAWLGVALDQPSLLGMTLIEIPPVAEPLLLDVADFGALPAGALPFATAAASWPDVLLTTPPYLLAAVSTDAFGYATVFAPNPNLGGLAGVTLMVQAVAVPPSGARISSPVLVQLQ
ncbi:MAG TPA: hypothetical protein ENI87_15430 [bacterium]|nr:hypothetical protein [bacterium]